MLKESDFKILSRKTLNKGWLDIKQDKIRLPNQKEQTYEYMHKGGAVIVIAKTDDDKIVTIKEFRVPIKKIVKELPAGLIEPGEMPVDAARRELEEETGYHAENIELLTSLYPLIGMSDIKLYLFFASKLRKTEQHLDPAEFIDVELTPIKEYKNYLLNINNAKEASWILALLLAEKKGLL